MVLPQGAVFVLFWAFLLRPVYSSDVNQIPYISPMLLGRTFDISTSEIGNDIFSNDVRDKCTKIRQDKTTIQFRMVKDMSDIEDLLSVSGQLALQIKGGLVNIEGSGSYLKETTDKKDFVEVMAKVKCRTETQTLTSNLSPVTGFADDKLIGKHYIRSITYGGLLLASLRFTVKKGAKKEDIEAKVKGSMNTMSVNIGLEGQFKKLASEVKDLSELSIRYYSTAPLKTVPADVDTLISAIQEFPEQLKTVNEGKGIPIFANIQELSTLDNNNKKLTYVDNRLLRATIDDLYELYTDLLETSEAVKYWLKNTVELNKSQLTKVQVFYKKLSTIIGVFDSAIASIDLNCGGEDKPCSTDQFEIAFTKYEGDGQILPGKYLREFNRLKWDIELTAEVEQQITDMIEEKSGDVTEDVDRVVKRFKRIIKNPKEFVKDADKTISNLLKILPGKFLLAYQKAGTRMYAGDTVPFQNLHESSLKGFRSSTGILTIKTEGVYLISYALRIIKDGKQKREGVRVDLAKRLNRKNGWKQLSYTIAMYEPECPRCDRMLSDTVTLVLHKDTQICLRLGDDKLGKLIGNENNYLSVLLLRDLTK